MCQHNPFYPFCRCHLMEGWIDGCRCDDDDDDDDLVQSVSQSVGWSKKSHVHMTKILTDERLAR